MIISVSYINQNNPYYFRQQKFSTEHSEAKLERDPEKKHRFILKIDGVSVFQWFRDMARKFLEKMGFRQPEPRQRSGIRQ